MGAWSGVVFIVLVAVVLFVERRRMAGIQAAVIGGSVNPGCVVFEVVVLLLIALAIAAAQWLQWV